MEQQEPGSKEICREIFFAEELSNYKEQLRVCSERSARGTFNSKPVIEVSVAEKILEERTERLF